MSSLDVRSRAELKIKITSWGRRACKILPRGIMAGGAMAGRRRVAPPSAGVTGGMITIRSLKSVNLRRRLRQAAERAWWERSVEGSRRRRAWNQPPRRNPGTSVNRPPKDWGGPGLRSMWTRRNSMTNEAHLVRTRTSVPKSYSLRNALTTSSLPSNVTSTATNLGGTSGRRCARAVDGHGR